MVGGICGESHTGGEVTYEAGKAQAEARSYEPYESLGFIVKALASL